MKILVLGGAGFLGANLVRRCLAEPNVQLTVLDPLLNSPQKNLDDILDRIHFVIGDLRDEALLSELVQDQDVVFNSAAQSSHTLSIQYPLLDTEINCLGNLKLLEAVRRYNRKAILVFPSASTVIGTAQENIVDEDHKEVPLEIYSANKGVVEKYYRIYHALHGLKTVILRFTNLYGPYGKGSPEFGFVNYFIHLASNNGEIKIFGDGSQSRNVLYVEDAAEILWRAAWNPKLYGKLFFAASPYHLSVREIAETIVSVWGRGKVVYDPWPEERRLIEVGSVRFSSARLKALTGWEASYDFVSGLKKTREIMERSLQAVKS